MDLREIHKSKTVRGIVMGLGIAVITLIIFQAGLMVGYHKARFGSQFGDNFNRNFIDPHRDGFEKRLGGGFPGGHGAVGKIVSITLPQIVVAGPDNLEKTIIVGASTLIREFQNEITANNLKIGDSLVVLGTPNNSGQVEATLIRVIP